MGVVKNIGKSLGLIAERGPTYNYDSELNAGLQGQNQQDALQTELSKILYNQVQGTGPSVAQAQMQQGLQTAQQNQAGAMASQKGLNPALAARMIGNQGSNMAANVAGQSGVLRAQEQLGAQSQYMNALQQQRAQNQNMYLGAANLRAGHAAGAQSQANTEASQMGNVYGGLGSMVQGIGSMLTGKAHGGMIEGEAPVYGDSPVNDIVPAKLSPGEIVIPRSAAGSPEKAKAFIDELMKKKDSELPENGYGRVLAKNRELESRLAKLEAMNSGGKVGYADGGEVEDTAAMDDAEDSGLSFDENSDANYDDAPTSEATQGSVPLVTTQTDYSMPNTDFKKQSKGLSTAALAAPGLKGEIDAAAAKQKQGIQGVAQAQAQEGAMQADVYGIEQTDLQKNETDFNKNMEGLRKESEALYNDYKNQKVDPHAFFSNMGVGQKLTNGIALILGGIGQMGTGKNAVADRLEKMVDNDIMSQKENIANKANLYNFNLKKTNDAVTAMQLTKSNILDVTKAKIAQIAAKSTDPKVTANAQILAGQIDQKQAILHAQIATAQAKPSQKVVTLPNGKQITAPDSKVAGEMKTKAVALTSLKSYIDQAKALQKKVGNTGAWSYENRNEANDLKQKIAQSVAASRGMRVNPVSLKYLEDKVVPDFGDMLHSDVKIKDLDQLYDMEAEGLNSLVKVHSPEQANSVMTKTPNAVKTGIKLKK